MLEVEHEEAVEADSDTAAIGKSLLKSFDECLIDGESFFPKLDSFLILFFKPLSLLSRFR